MLHKNSSAAYKPRRFQKKLLAAFLLCSVFPVLLIGMVAYRLSYSIAKNSIMDSVLYTSQQSIQSVSNRFAQMEKVSDFTQFQLYRLSTSPRLPLTEYVDQYLEMRNNITSLTYSFDIYSVNIFLNQEEMITSEGLMFAPLEAVQELGIDLDDLEDPGARRLKWTLLQDVQIKRVPVRPGETENFLCCYWFKRNVGTREIEYAYFVTLQNSQIAPLLDGGDPNVTRYLAAPDGVILVHPDETQVGARVPEEVLPLLGDPSETYDSIGSDYVSVQALPGYDWLLVTSVGDRYIRDQTNVLISILLVALACVLVTVAVVVSFLSRSMSDKVNLLAHTMRRYKTSNDKKGLTRLDKMIQKPENRRDEFDEMAVDFRDMAGRLDENFQQMIDMRLREEHLNYQLLQAKINPHFLYNILESIKTCIVLGQPETADEMISKLARFYRQQLGRAGELVEIREELDTARTYLDIESLSRGGQLHLDIQTDEGIENFLICRFSLQPILENCVQHALPDGERPIHIRITVQYDDDQIRLEVRDDGEGMEPEKLESVRKSLRELQVDSGKHFGICNVNARLAMHSRKGSGCIQIDSVKGEGAAVTLLIDQILGDDGAV